MLLALTAASGFAAAAPGGSFVSEEAPFDRTCPTRVEGPAGGPQAPYGRRDVRFGRLIFIGLDRPQRWRQRRGADGTMKIPVVLREGTAVTVTIRPIGRTRARLDFDREEWTRTGRRVAGGDGQRAVRFHACPANTPRFSDGRPIGPWTGYNGGFLVDRPGCVRLTVSAEAMPTMRRRAALGVPVSRCRR